MFVSFFSRPLALAVSATLWAAFAVGFWYTFGSQTGELLGFHLQASGTKTVGAAVFWSAQFLWFYLYFVVAVALFAATWMLLFPHPWSRSSILGSALILFTSYFQVQVSVAINDWYGPFYYSGPGGAFENRARHTASILPPACNLCRNRLRCSNCRSVDQIFFVSHYIFRWRTAMNAYYAAHWPQLRTVEGASQRVQEDTMRFATSMEGLGVSLVDAIMTLIAFLPVLVRLSSNVTELPLIGTIPYPLVAAALLWAMFGTAFLALIGMRLPGLEFHNQRVEAAYRKELVLGEDDPVGGATNSSILLQPSAKTIFGFILSQHVLQCRCIRISADGATHSVSRFAPDHRGRKIHAWSVEPDSQCLHPGSIVISIPCELVAPNCRIDFDL